MYIGPSLLILIWKIKSIACEEDISHHVEGKIFDTSGEKNAAIEEVPYQVALIYNGEAFCGGSIISKDVILTAAHCVYNYPAKRLKVMAGSSELYTGKIYKVKSVRIHEAYQSLDYDIALMTLVKSLNFGPGVQPIKLAETQSPDNSKANVTGWGMTHYWQFPTYLKIVTLLTISWKECKSAYGSYLTNRMICAGYPEGGKDSCYGDSGGPLVDMNTKEQIGIVSWGNGCGQPDFPGVYTSVSVFNEWISEQMR